MKVILKNFPEGNLLESVKFVIRDIKIVEIVSVDVTCGYL